MMKQHMKVLAFLVNFGKPATKTDLETGLKDSGVELYRMSTYMWKLKNMGANIKVHKSGKNVVAYELLNAAFMDGVLQACMIKPVKSAKVTKTTKVVSIPENKVVETITREVTTLPSEEFEDGELPNTVDPDFDNVDTSDLMPA